MRATITPATKAAPNAASGRSRACLAASSASTLLLARQVLGERLRAIQVAGVACALGALALIAVAQHL